MSAVTVTHVVAAAPAFRVREGAGHKRRRRVRCELLSMSDPSGGYAVALLDPSHRLLDAISPPLPRLRHRLRENDPDNKTLHSTAPGCIAALRLALVRSTSVLAGSTLARLARAGCNLAQRGATPLVLFRTWRRALARSLSVEVLGVQVVRLSRAGVFGRAGPPSMSSREGTM